jgi:Na+/H+ antiporter NhaD/arsenite permease-like protein
MIPLLILLFILGYCLIAFEDVVHLSKTASALITGVLCWVIIALAVPQSNFEVDLAHHFEGIAEILFFLLGAMTIVELIDAHDGFSVITDRITTTQPRVLLWVIAIIAFFLSALLDNLTTAIVMVTLLRKLIIVKELRHIMAGVVVIAANAGGAWSPIGDVTTTMLWIGTQITTVAIIKNIFLPSIMSAIVPVFLIGLNKIFTQTTLESPTKNSTSATRSIDKMVILGVGLGGLLFVPLFKTFTHLPPYMGMMLVLGVIWIVSEIIHKHKDDEARKPFTAAFALSRIDSTSILFFLGILLAVSALENAHILAQSAAWFNQNIKNLDIIAVLIGLASAIVDNVPLVAASMGMYDLTTYPTDHRLWHLLAYTSGTGGSILIIGSAAGVAVMGLEHISFGWYLRRISIFALVGYFVGALVYILMH